MGFDEWGASGTIAFDPDPSSPLGASFNVSQSWGITPRIGFGGSQNMGTMREREPLPRSVTGMSRPNLYGQPLRIEGEMGYGFSASGGKGVATPYAGVAFSDRDRSGVLLGLNLQAGRRFSSESRRQHAQSQGDLLRFHARIQGAGPAEVVTRACPRLRT